jgi:putative heme-binding domain-containing protein
LFDLLNPKEPANLQATAISQLSRIRNQGVAEELVKRWPTLGPKSRAGAGNILLYQASNHDLLLTALENGDLIPGELNLKLGQRRVLLFSKNEAIAARAEKIFTDAGVVTRKEALDRMKPATTMKGDAAKGAVLFSTVCASCHTIGTVGSDLAPNLTDIFRKSPETLLHDIVDPNAAIDAEYIAYNVELANGDFFSGIVVRDDDLGVTLRNATEERSFARGDIVDMFSSGLSLMPEELEADMDPQAMADLIAFLQQPR